MKYILLIFTLTILYSETYSDVIYLKDGSIIYGTI